MEADDLTSVEAVYPDGLTAEVIEGLLCEAHTFWAKPTLATSALLDGSAALHRERRTTRRQMGAVVRALPMRSAALFANAPADEVA
jgi:hypothetical protein